MNLFLLDKCIKDAFVEQKMEEAFELVIEKILR